MDVLSAASAAALGQWALVAEAKGRTDMCHCVKVMHPAEETSGAKLKQERRYGPRRRPEVHLATLKPGPNATWYFYCFPGLTPFPSLFTDYFRSSLFSSGL